MKLIIWGYVFDSAELMKIILVLGSPTLAVDVLVLEYRLTTPERLICYQIVIMCYSILTVKRSRMGDYLKNLITAVQHRK